MWTAYPFTWKVALRRKADKVQVVKRYRRVLKYDPKDA